MAIKKINRNKIGEKKVVTPVETVEEVQEEVVEEVQEEVVEEFVEEIIPEEEVEEEEVQEEVVEEVKKVKPVSKPGSKPATKVASKPVNNKEEKKMSKPTLGTKKKTEKVVTEERKIGTVYPKDLLQKDIQAGLEERFGEVSLADCKFILDVVEAKILEACQVASLRMFGGILSAKERNASVTKSPTVDYSSFTGKRNVITITGAEVGQPEKYRGTREGNTFVVTEVYNYETKKYEPAEGTLTLNEDGEWE